MVPKNEQEHAGEVDAQTPDVQYGYVLPTFDRDGDGNPDDYIRNFRANSVTYPNARVVKYDYGSGSDDALNRIHQIENSDGSEVFAEYTYAGRRRRQSRRTGEQVNRRSNSSDTWQQAADGRTRFACGLLIYCSPALAVRHRSCPVGMPQRVWPRLEPPSPSCFGVPSRFGRITATKWQLGSAGTVIDHFTYGYDRNSNRLYKKNEHTSGGNFSEMYRDGDGSKASAYDGLNRLTGFTRGTLTVQSPSPELSIASDQRRQQFGYDGLGNWSTFKSDDGNGSDWDLEQSRTNNLANEITGITETHNDPVWVDPAYDKAGSMISGPTPGDEATEHCYQESGEKRQ
jgi:hypothetical protein